MKINQFKQRFVTDKTKENKGVRVPVGEGFVIYVARTGNDAAREKFEQLVSASDVLIARKAGALSAEKQAEIALEVFASCILVGWDGLEDDNGPIPYSVEKAKELLANQDFLNFVREFAETQENYRRDNTEEAADALGKPSNGG